MTKIEQDSDQANAMREVWFFLSDNERMRFIEENIYIPTTKGSLIPLEMTLFQRKWFLDGPVFNDFTKINKFWNRICLKIRNVGASLVMIGVESVLTCWLYPNIFVPFVSATETQAIDLIKHCKKIIKNANFSIPLNVPLENQTQTQITFANGSIIRSFSGGHAAGIRGPRSMISYIDEFAFNPHPQEVMSAVEYFHTEGGQLNILSTPFGKQNLYWQIYADTENFVGWRRHSISLFTDMTDFDVRHSLIDYVVNKGKKLTCPWLNLDFLENKRLGDAPFDYVNFLQEGCGVPVDEVTAIITEDTLNTNCMDYYEVEGKSEEKIFVISADFGAEANMTAICVFEAKDGRFVVCHTESFRGDFVEQVGRVKNIVSRYDPAYFVGDETGMGGMSWMSTLRDVINKGTVIGINYSKKDIAQEYGVDMNNKNFFVTTSIRLLAEGLIMVPKNHRRLREELLGMQKIVYEKNVKYTGKEGPAHGDDLAMAFMQGSLIFNRVYETGESEGAGGANMGLQMSRETRLKRPLFKPLDKSVEAAGWKKDQIKRETLLGFKNLI